MNAYKFDIKVGKDGSIHLPYISDLVNQDVEVIIVPGHKTGIKVPGDYSAKDFVHKWTGILTGDLTSPSRLEYISEKYS